MDYINVGVDIGNYDTKTPLSVISSGYNEFSSLPFGVDDYVLYQGTYYVPSDEKFPYVKDKTTSDHCFILTLFAIAKEVIGVVSKRICKDGIQAEIDKVHVINLCGGLPPAHMQKLKVPMINYYRERFGNDISFEANHFQFHFRIGELEIIPQDYAAIAGLFGKDENSIINKYNYFVSVDIGGMTVDVVPIKKRRPVAEKSISLELGVLRFCDDVIAKIEREYGITVDRADIENILKKEESILDEEIKNYVSQESFHWITNIMNKLKQSGIEFQTTPAVFLGGGSRLFQKDIERNDLLKVYQFIGDAKSNAEGYKKYLKTLIDRKRLECDGRK